MTVYMFEFAEFEGIQVRSDESEGLQIDLQRFRTWNFTS